MGTLVPLRGVLDHVRHELCRGLEWGFGFRFSFFGVRNFQCCTTTNLISGGVSVKVSVPSGHLIALDMPPLCPSEEYRAKFYGTPQTVLNIKTTTSQKCEAVPRRFRI